MSLCVSSQTGYAQTATDQSIQQNRDLIQDFEQQKRFEEQQKVFEQEQKALGADLDYKARELPESGPCIDVKALNIEGITLLPDTTINQLKSEYQGQCLYISDINKIAETINGLYVDKGYISSRAYIPAQDLSSGVLNIQVIEGRLEEIQSEHSDLFQNELQNQFYTAFPNMIGEPLNIRDIEQGLDQINRLQSNNSKMDLLPGEKAGGSILAVKNEKTKPWQIVTGIDNSGTQPTGVLQGSVNASYDDPLGLNDLIRVNFKHDLDRTKNRQSKSLGFNYEVPYGYWTFGYGLSFFDYISQVVTSTQTFKTEGRTRNHTFSANNVLHRNQNGKTTLNASMVFKENENYFEDVKLDVSSRKLSIANIGLSHSHQIPNGFLYGAVTYSRGIKLFGAFKDKSIDPSAPVGQFDKFSFDVNAIKAFDLGWNNYNPRFDIQGNGVLSPDSLFGTEQISIGGPYSVRGFKSSSISGDRGGYLRADLSTGLPTFPQNSLKKAIGQVRPFVGFDIGSIVSDQKVATEGGTLKSMSVGVKNSGGRASFGLTYTKPISSPRFVTQESEEVFFQLSVKF